MSNLAVNSITDASGGTTASINGYTPSASNMTGRNLVINGGMQISQRGTSFTGLGNGDIGYTLDRFRFVEVGTPTFEFTVEQSTEAPAGFGNSLKMSNTTSQASLSADVYVAIDTPLEANTLQVLAYGSSSAKVATLSFWVRSNKTGTYTIEFYQDDDARQVCASYTIDSADTWEQKTVNIPADTVGVIDNDNGRGITLRWCLGAGTDFTSGTLPTAWRAFSNTGRYAGQTVNLADSTSNTFYLTGVQLEVGSSASEFEHRLYGTELALCQRYYEVNRYNTQNYSTISSISPTGANHRYSWQYKQEKRTSPTVAVVTGSWQNSTASIYPGITDCEFYSTDYFWLGGTNGNISVSCSAEL